MWPIEVVKQTAPDALGQQQIHLVVHKAQLGALLRQRSSQRRIPTPRGGPQSS